MKRWKKVLLGLGITIGGTLAATTPPRRSVPRGSCLGNWNRAAPTKRGGS